jgi:hypothetical protein
VKTLANWIRLARDGGIIKGGKRHPVSDLEAEVLLKWSLRGGPHRMSLDQARTAVSTPNRRARTFGAMAR